VPFLPPESDVPVAQLTLAGRNLLARSIVPRGKLDGNAPDLPLVSFKLAGFAVGDGGYSLSNPLQLTAINDQTTEALATVAVLDNRFDVNDAIVINGVSFPAGILLVASGTATGGTDNGGTTAGYNDGVTDNSLGFGGTVDLAPNTLVSGAHIGQTLRLTGGTLGGLTEQIVTNSAIQIEIGITNPSAPLPIGSPLGKSWTQSGGWGTVPDHTTTWEIYTNAPGANTWVPGSTLSETATNIAAAINASSNPLIQNVVKATVSGDVVSILAIANGDIGNLNTVVEVDAGGHGINNFGITPGTGFLAGGISPSLESQKFPSAFPNVEAFYDIELPNISAVSCVCRIGTTDANVGLGELGIYVDITDSVNPDEIGSRILYAVSHFAIVAKNANSNFVTRAITQY
jgi:hypothetical protein